MTKWGILIKARQVAIKILEKEKIKDDSDKERVNRELKILKMIKHPNIIQLYEVNPIKLIELPFFWIEIDHRN